MLAFIKTIFTTFPPGSTAAFALAILIIVGWFVQSSLKWFLEFNAKRQDARDKQESENFKSALQTKEKKIEQMRQEKSGSVNEHTALLQKTYETIKQLNENNTGITREEFENLNKKVRDIDNMTRKELNELRAEVNRILGRLEK